MKTLASVVGAVFVLCSLAARAAERPNIVLVVSDDHRWGDYSFMGHPLGVT
jgi:uncharacterized sulfatase